MGCGSSWPAWDHANRTHRMALALDLCTRGTSLPHALPPLAVACQALIGPDIRAEDRAAVRSILPKVPIFFTAQSENAVLDELSRWFRPITVPYSELVVRFEQKGTSLFLVGTGQCGVENTRGTCVFMFKEGSSFGETALFYDVRRMADVRAGGPEWKRSVVLYVVDRYRFHRAMRRFPNGVELLRAWGDICQSRVSQEAPRISHDVTEGEIEEGRFFF